MGERLSADTLDRLRTWAFLGVVISAALIIGLSNAVWSTTCSDFLGIITLGCYSESGVSSEVLFGFGDGKATAGLGLALLAICTLTFAFPESRGTWMVWGTMVGLVAAALTILPAQEYWSRGTISQSLMLMTAAAVAAPMLSLLFLWLDIKHDHATASGDNEVWA